MPTATPKPCLLRRYPPLPSFFIAGRHDRNAKVSSTPSSSTVCRWCLRSGWWWAWRGRGTQQYHKGEGGGGRGNSSSLVYSQLTSLSPAEGRSTPASQINCLFRLLRLLRSQRLFRIDSLPKSEKSPRRKKNIPLFLLIAASS